MKIKTEKINDLIKQVDEIVAVITKKEKEHKDLLKGLNPTYRKSGKNLIHYNAFRSQDLRSLQKKLRNLGMSRFARAQGHVKASLLNTRLILNSLAGTNHQKEVKSGLSIKKGKSLLVNHTKELLGYRSKGRRVRIMVTQPTQASHDYELVYNMVKNGMNCARINCAHDSPEVWEKIINNVKKAAHTLGKNVKITMDLAGPKIRTGAIQAGPRVRKFSPERDALGNVISPSIVILCPLVTEESLPNTIAVNAEWLEKLTIGDKIKLTDTRNSQRRLKVFKRFENELWAYCYDTSYIGTGTILYHEDENIGSTKVGQIPPIEQYLLLRNEDVLTIHKEDKFGEPPVFDEDGNVIQKAHISCQVPAVFEAVKVGDPILFDDGKIEGVIQEVQDTHFNVLITRAKETGAKLKAEKGMNFPLTNLGISGLTEKDKEDLAFVAQHADVVNFSFVNNKEDVEELLAELEKHDVINKLSIILKIETRAAFDNLTEILLTAMQVQYIGVMIARGDLAVETGWDNISRVQQEILSICNAAHVPVVWATQVLENLAKKGLPSRSEITDAATSLRAECVMLNKGAYINNAIQLLDKILSDMESFQEKNVAMLPPLEKLSS
ncbi:MAG: pyruvate kinase [Bacteroidota bacterium]